MPINSKHREFISRNISDNVIHELQSVVDNEGEGGVISAEAITRRIEAINSVLENKAHQTIPEAEENVGYCDVNDILTRFYECLQHECPQNFTKKEAQDFLKVQQENLTKVAAGQPTESLPVGFVTSAGDNEFSIETLGGANLSGKKYGLLGVCVADTRGEQISAEEIKTEIKNSLESVKFALELKRKALLKLSENGVDADVVKICELILRSDNAADPKSLTRENLGIINGIIKNRSSTEINFFNAIKDLNPAFESLFPKESVAEEELEEDKLDLAYGISVSLGGGIYSEDWDNLKARLLHDSDERKKFYNIVQAQPIFDPSEIIFELDVLKAVRNSLASKTSAVNAANKKSKKGKTNAASLVEDVSETTYEELVAAVVSNPNIFVQLQKALLSANNNKGEFNIGIDESSQLLSQMASQLGRNIATLDEELNKPLLSKISNPRSFKNDEFTDHDAASYSEHIFLDKYPQASVFADYSTTGIVQGANILSDKMADTLGNGKWGFFHYSNGGHWRLVVVSPQREVICLDSIGSGDKGKVPSYIETDITNAFNKAKLSFKGQIKYYGLETQRGVQCGLHSCLAMEEVIRSIIESNKNTLLDAEKSYKLKAQRVISDYQMPPSKEINNRDLILLNGAKEHISDPELNAILSSVVSAKKFTSEEGRRFNRLQKKLSESLRSEVNGYSFGVLDIIKKAENSKDPIREKLTDKRIVESRIGAASMQLDDFLVECLGMYQEAETIKKFQEKSANKILPKFSDYSAKFLPQQAANSGIQNSNSSASNQISLDKSWKFSEKTHAITTHSKPNAKIKVRSVEPVLSNDKSVWINSDRGNKFRVIEGVYGQNGANIQIEIGRTFIGILQKIAKEVGEKLGSKFSKDQVLAIIDAAKERGGVSNKVNADDKYLSKEELEKTKHQLGKIKDVAPEVAKYFSGRFQQECEKCGIYTGQEGEGAKMVGLRLTFIPDDVVDFMKNNKLENRISVANEMEQRVSKIQSKVQMR